MEAEKIDEVIKKTIEFWVKAVKLDKEESQNWWIGCEWHGVMWSDLEVDLQFV